MVGIKRIRCKSGKPKGNPYPNFMGVSLSITASTGSKHRHKTTDCDGEYPGGVPCTIDVSKVNPLDLGEMVTTQVNGISGKMLIPYEVKCTTPTNLKMTILTSSAATWYGNGTLATVGLNNQNLGIQLLKEGGAAVVFNDAMPFNSSTPPKLYAVPVKRTGSSLSAAVFYSASATMRVEFP